MHSSTGEGQRPWAGLGELLPVSLGSGLLCPGHTSRQAELPQVYIGNGLLVLLQADVRPLFHQVTLSNVLYFPYIFFKVCMKDTEILQQEESCLDIFVSKECLRLLGGVGWG